MSASDNRLAWDSYSKTKYASPVYDLLTPVPGPAAAGQLLPKIGYKCMLTGRFFGCKTQTSRFVDRLIG